MIGLPPSPPAAVWTGMMEGCTWADGQSAPPGGSTFIAAPESPLSAVLLNCQVEPACAFPMRSHPVRQAFSVALFVPSETVNRGAMTPLVTEPTVSTLPVTEPVICAPYPHAPLNSRLLWVIVSVVDATVWLGETV